MKINIRQLRQLINEVYMSPRNIRGVGPDIDTDPAYGGKLSSEQVLMKFPKAARQWVVMLRSIHGELAQWGPKSLMDLAQFRVDEDDSNKLYADPKQENHRIDYLNSIWRWDDQYGWESLS